MIDQDRDLAPYIGRTEAAHDVVDAERLTRLAALLDRKWTAGDPLPPLAHFALFRPDALQSRIGPDGHPLRDPTAMLPAIALPRRMWAGSRICFHQNLTVDRRVRRDSRLAKATAKSGKSGSLVFCTVEHIICDYNDNSILITEEQDLVYRGAHEGPGLAMRPSIDPAIEPDATRNITVGPVELFRYSALTFNSHRIHYDRDYASVEEGYQGLVVHGPFLATLLFDHLEAVAGDRRVKEFSFSAKSPSFDGEDLMLGSKIDGDRVALQITHSHGMALQGSALLSDYV